MLFDLFGLNNLWFIIVVVFLATIVIRDRRKWDRAKEGEKGIEDEVVEMTESEVTDARRRIEELKEKVVEELGRDIPNVEEMKEWQKEIGRLERGIKKYEEKELGAESEVVSAATAKSEEAAAAGGVSEVVAKDGEALEAESGATDLAKKVGTEKDGELARESGRKEEKAKNNGLNLVLYIGALLVIAGVSGLIFATSDETMQLIVTMVATLCFYFGGIIIRRDERLKMAGNAMIGTGLGIIPFWGLAFYNFAHLSPEGSWFMTSMIGIIAYVVAAIIMQSEVVSYLAIGFLVSTGCSFSAVLSLPMIWYYVSAMIIGLILFMVSRVVEKKSLNVLANSVAMSGRYLAALAVVASWSVFSQTDIWFYAFLHLVIMVQMLVIWRDSKTYIDELVFRGAAQVWVIVLCCAIWQDNPVGIGYGVMVSGEIHALVSLFLRKKRAERMTADENEEEMTVLLAMLGEIIVGAMVMWAEGKVELSIGVAVSWMLVGVNSILASRIYRDTNWLYGAVAGMVIIPAVLGVNVFGVTSLALAYLYLMYLVTCGYVLVAMARSKKVLKGEFGEIVMSVFFGAVIVMTLGSAVSEGTEPPHFLNAVAGYLWGGLMMVYGFLQTEKVDERAKYAKAGVIGVALGSIAFGRGIVEGVSESAVGAIIMFMSMVLPVSGLLIYLARGKKILLNDFGEITISVMAMICFIVFRLWTEMDESAMFLARAAMVWMWSGTIAGYLRVKKREGMMEVPVYGAVLGAMIMMGGTIFRGLENVALPWMVYLHMAVFTMISMSVWKKEKAESCPRLKTALGSLTFWLMMAALSGSDDAEIWQLAFLIEEVIVMVAGFSLKIDWMRWLGAIAVVAAVMWFTKELAWIWLLLLGVGLIGFGIYRSVKIGEKKQ